MSPAEYEEDDNINRKVWRVVVHWANSNEGRNALDAFKYFFRFSRALDHDATIEKIMDSVHAFRDEDDIGFKEALNRALKKRKYLVYRALREQSNEESSHNQSDDELGEINIWKEMKSDDGDIFEDLRKHILFCRSLKRDAVFRSVMELVQNCMQDIDPMDNDEALDYALDVKSEDIEESARTRGKQD